MVIISSIFTCVHYLSIRHKRVAVIYVFTAAGQFASWEDTCVCRYRSSNATGLCVCEQGCRSVSFMGEQGLQAALISMSPAFLLPGMEGNVL